MKEEKLEISTDELNDISVNVKNMIEIRKNFDNYNQNISKYFSTLYLDFGNDIVENSGSGTKNKRDIVPYTSSDERASSLIFPYVDNFVSFFMDLLVSPGNNWLEIEIGLMSDANGMPKENLKNNDEINNYLDLVKNCLLEFLDGCNFYKIFGLAVSDAVNYGYGCMMMDIKDKMPKLKYAVLTECYYDMDMYGDINIFVRKFNMTEKEMKDFFDADKIQYFLSDMKSKSPSVSNEYTIIQYIQKGYFDDGESLSVYFAYGCDTEKSILKIEKISYDNFFVVRWDQKGGFAYPEGQSLKILEEVINLNHIAQSDRALMKDSFMASYGYHDKGFDNIDPGNLYQGYFVKYSDRVARNPELGKINRLLPEINPQKPMLNYEIIISAIQKVFFADYVQLRGGTKTATEVLRLNADMTRVLQPRVSQIYNETVQPILSAILDSLMKSGKIPDLDTVGLKEVKFVFLSEVDLSNRDGQKNDLSQMGAALAQYRDITGSPVFSMSIDPYKTLDKIKKLYRADRTNFRNKEEIEEELKQMAERQDVAEQAQLAKVMSEAERNNASAIKDTSNL